jgi:hypothetical protein
MSHRRRTLFVCFRIDCAMQSRLVGLRFLDWARSAYAQRKFHSVILFDIALRARAIDLAKSRLFRHTSWQTVLSVV